MSRAEVEAEAKHARAMAVRIEVTWAGANGNVRRRKAYRKAMRERDLWIALAEGAEAHLRRRDDEEDTCGPGPDDAPMF